ncbi:hypothetical protein [Candidatus Ichthyocystis sparus]|uniref:hypothetical protein n=1 Tax=Candidatus Ichthyocystis sparus TaxID=1561004 RepID=UPI000B815C59|nr:hypothetical protein [Candidatus Ichthyocystis sparus]
MQNYDRIYNPAASIKPLTENLVDHLVKGTVKYDYSDYAIKSNVSKNEIVDILSSRWNSGTLRYEHYCPDIIKYMNVSKRKIIDVKYSENNAETDNSIALVLTSLMFFGVLLLFFYALYNLAKSRHSSIRNTLREAPYAIYTRLKPSDDEHHVLV